MKFLVIEGLDGSGKSTQVNMLRNWLEMKDVSHEYIHFPRTHTPVYGELIAKFLRGDLGENDDVNPYLVALLFAGDQGDAAELINRWRKDNKFVLVDRYVYSNIAYQCAKFDNPAEQMNLMNWILRTEFDYFTIPKPDMSLFLNVPLSFVESRLSQNRQGTERDYLNGKGDIHEADMRFQVTVRNMYKLIAKREEGLQMLDCSDDDGNMMKADEIFDKMITLLKNQKIVD
ncbi:MAG TPA: dTMP kinase [Bacteroidales bacterium]|nr:dTMP kinase [Bacteroidales bacterium]